ncbi:MAG: LysM peptidoglycan-binding domain-containing protein, partial [Thermoclostridium sp.]|nr:LysM peptidoglycan-binding domain-containing protein [Thermoclostridium sp.]
MWYIVIAGDSLSRIAQRFGTTVETLQQANKLSGTGLS